MRAPIPAILHHQTKMTRTTEAIAYLRRQIDTWVEQSRERPGCAKLTDEQVKERMAGHAMWDDPPAGYDERRLADWSRGYLWGSAVEAGNAAGAVDFALWDIDTEQTETNQRLWDLSRRTGQRIILDYAFALQEDLDEFVAGTETKHYLKVLTSPTLAAVSIEFVQDPFRKGLPAWMELAVSAGFQTFYRGATAIAIQHSQAPMYEELGIHVKADNIIRVCHPSNCHFWSNVQSWEDSGDIIATILNAKTQKSMKAPTLNPP